MTSVWISVEEINVSHLLVASFPTTKIVREPMPGSLERILTRLVVPLILESLKHKDEKWNNQETDLPCSKSSEMERSCGGRRDRWETQQSLLCQRHNLPGNGLQNFNWNQHNLGFKKSNKFENRLKKILTVFSTVMDCGFRYFCTGYWLSLWNKWRENLFIFVIVIYRFFLFYCCCKCAFLYGSKHSRLNNV